MGCRAGSTQNCWFLLFGKVPRQKHFPLRQHFHFEKRFPPASGSTQRPQKRGRYFLRPFASKPGPGRGREQKMAGMETPPPSFSPIRKSPESAFCLTATPSSSSTTTTQTYQRSRPRKDPSKSISLLFGLRSLGAGIGERKPNRGLQFSIFGAFFLQR